MGRGSCGERGCLQRVLEASNTASEVHMGVCVSLSSLFLCLSVSLWVAEFTPGTKGSLPGGGVVRPQIS